VLDLSYNMPVKIEILLPPAEVDSAVAELRRMAPDAVILVRGEPHASA
jgi:PII-like signaling protein